MLSVYQGKEVKVIPSFTMFTTWLTMSFKSPVTPNPVIGVSSQQDQINGALFHTREVAFHFPFHPLPLIADKHEWPGEDFTRHDRYHVVRASDIPHEHQFTFLTVADMCNEKWQARKKAAGLNFPFKIWHLIRTYEETSDETAYREMRGYCIDMEFPSYLAWDYPEILSEGLRVEDCFWAGILNLLNRYVSFSYKEEENFLLALCKKEQHTKIGQALNQDLVKGWYKNAPNLDSLIHQLLKIWKRLNNPTELYETHQFTIQSKNEEALKEFIEKEMKPYFTPDNIFGIMSEAKKRNCKELFRAAVVYMGQNLLAVVKTKEFEAFRKEKPPVSRGLL